ncbi:uncharacterized protein LOC116046982 [Sander lucioperca]|uniref:uncharacterized protein LOC116046982 n=1 Tax=Sander lucioperca TaxID=283035 RepID=UPI00125DC07C|nr:uncharacterized protein LOC116046982 [Sander lucioperca]
MCPLMKLRRKFQLQGFKKINVNLNQGAGGNAIYLWYKNGSPAITKLQVTYNHDMAAGFQKAGYTQISNDLNVTGVGDPTYLWYFKGSGDYDTPIVDIDVTTDPEKEAVKFSTGWETLACDLNNNAGGNWVYVWVKREKQTYICAVSATNTFSSNDDYLTAGYIRLDEDTNTGAVGCYVFIWYQQTTDPKRALTDLKISTNDKEYQPLKQQDYTRVVVNLNKGTGGNKVYLWYKKGGVKPIKAITLLINPSAVSEYKNAGATVIEKNLSKGIKSQMKYLCFYQ